MDNNTIPARVIRAITEQLCLLAGDVKPESHLANDLGADSLDKIEIVMALEDEFAIMINDDEVDPCKTVADIIALVSRKAVPDVVQ